jgi:enamine deaminase RidA (YjgF/YER057c/UK114 family)
MTDQEDRERESRESDVTKFEEQTEQVLEHQQEVAEEISKPLPPRED